MTNRALVRRDPQKGKKGFSKTRGFTLIELMVVVAVMAIIASLALPSYRTIIEKRAVVSGANQVKAFITQAQMTSIKRNEFVAVNFESWTNSGETSWCVGVASSENSDVSCNCRTESSCLIDGEEKVINSSDLNRPNILSDVIEVNGDDNNLVFDPIRGLVLGNETLQVQLVSPDQNTYALNVDVGVTGRVSICTDSLRSNYDAPGFRPCTVVDES